MNDMKKKAKQHHSTVSNIFFMLRTMFKVSPWLVIGEIFEQITGALPSKLISVIGLKYIIDEVQSGAEPKKIIFGIVAMLAVIVIAEIFTNVFYELFVHREREKWTSAFSRYSMKKRRSSIYPATMTPASTAILSSQSKTPQIISAMCSTS